MCGVWNREIFEREDREAQESSQGPCVCKKMSEDREEKGREVVGGWGGN